MMERQFERVGNWSLEHLASFEVPLVIDSIGDFVSTLSCDTHGRCDWHLSPHGQGFRRTQDDGGTDDRTQHVLEPKFSTAAASAAFDDHERSSSGGQGSRRGPASNGHAVASETSDLVVLKDQMQQVENEKGRLGSSL